MPARSSSRILNTPTLALLNSPRLASPLVGGILPFGAIFIELFFIMTSIWLQVRLLTRRPPEARRGEAN